MRIVTKYNHLTPLTVAVWLRSLKLLCQIVADANFCLEATLFAAV
jgi:hypothetical protein